jgi:hypothetical protein
MVPVLAGCPSESPPRGPEAICAQACAAHAHSACGDRQCARGCNLVLDRLVEHEGDRVVACVASSTACDDRAWARCAALVGPHADGGPPPPALARDALEGED